MEDKGLVVKTRSVALKRQGKRKKRVGSESTSEPDNARVDDIESVVGWEPDNWIKVYENIKAMRAASVAPVDTMGCDQCYERTDVAKEVQRFQVLVSLMLSSQTKDETTFAAMARLKKRGLTVDSVCQMDERELGELIQTVGFWKTKAKNIKRTADILKTEYNGDIPRTLQGLMRLPGVGPKMSHLAMQCAWNEVTGIAVDVHVHRISNRLGWVRKATKTPENTRKELEAWVPREYWNEINHALVGFGQTLCSAKKPQCGQCLNKDLCPFGEQFLRSLTKKAKTKKTND